MALFVFTLKLSTRGGNGVQEVIGEYQASSLSEIYDHLQRGQKWFLVHQHYSREGRDGKEWYPKNKVLIPVCEIGKIKEFVEYENS